MPRWQDAIERPHEIPLVRVVEELRLNWPQCNFQSEDIRDYRAISKRIFFSLFPFPFSLTCSLRLAACSY